MENFNLFNPTKLIFGKDTIPEIGKYIKESGLSKVLLVAGGGSIRNNNVYSKVIKSLTESDIKWFEHWGVQPNPTIRHTQSGIETAMKNEIDAVLAVGGGSVVDESKAIAAGFYLNNIWDAFEGKVRISKALPLFVVLSLSATGSEMNSFAVVTNEELKKKWAIGSPVLYPKISIIDPSVQASLPWYQTVNGSIDAISHVMEFYFTGLDEEVSLSINEALIKSVIKMTDILQENQTDYDARANLCYAATLALNGLSGAALKGGDWSTHTIEHSISSLFPKVAHGTGLAIVFPAWITHSYKLNEKTFIRWSKNIWNVENVPEAVAKMKSKFKEWGSPVNLREIGIKESDIEKLVKNALLSSPFGYLKKLSEKDIRSILELAY